MYARDESREECIDVLAGAMRAIRLGQFVTFADGAYHATHAPVVVREEGGLVTLQTHFARGNPHAGHALDGARTLVIFQGPHAYISPSFYPTKRETGKVVPTWVYIAVHAEGVLTRQTDPAWMEAHLNALTDTHEAPRPEPWAVSDAPDDFLMKMQRGIIGMEFRADKVTGAWKLNQHKAEPDFAGTRDGLAVEADEGAKAIAAAMNALT